MLWKGIMRTTAAICLIIALAIIGGCAGIDKPIQKVAGRVLGNDTNDRSPSSITSDIWENEITDIDVSPDPEFCLRSPAPKQFFSARLSKQAPGTKFQGTLLHLSGSPTTEYISDIASPRYISRKILELKLWKKGFRILEFKFSSKTGWNPMDHPDEEWEGSGLTCQNQPMVKALKILTDEGMLPKKQEERFALGTSNGALLLSYAIDYFQSPYAKFNRVLLQSPILYDAYSQCKESRDPLSVPFYGFYFPTQCQNPDEYKGEFFSNYQIRSAIDSDVCDSTLGKDSYLIVGGRMGEHPLWYNDIFTRYIPERESLCPLQTGSWEAPDGKYEGHAPIVTYYEVHENVDPFLAYFLTGEVNFR